MGPERRATFGADVIRGGVGRGLSIDPRRASADYVGGTSEVPVQEAVRRHLHRSGVFYDVGSNIGFFALIAARLVGSGGFVYAFEPVVENAACARANAAHNGFENVEVRAVAIGARSGRATLLLTRHPGGATLSTAETPPDLVGRRTVAVAAIDNQVDGGTIRPPSVVKIDVEGGEIEVLKGMTRTIAAARPVVILELDDATEAGMARKLAEVNSFFSTAGYATRRLDSSYAQESWQVLHLEACPAPVPSRAR